VAVGDIKSYALTQQGAASFYYGWTKRLLDHWSRS